MESSALSSPNPLVRIRHGRQFHNSSSNYGLPNDEVEHRRLDYQHEAMRIILGSNYTAPLHELNGGNGPRSILDVASGSGRWVLEIAEEFPKATVVGIDLSDPGLNCSSIPPSVSFVRGDITNPFPFESASFDVVQMRVVPSIQARATIYEEIHRVLRPGGLVELVEPGENVPSTGLNPPTLVKINEAISSLRHIGAAQPPGAAAGSKSSWSIATRIGSDLHNSPSMWADVHEKKVIIPIGVWTENESEREAGKLMQHCAVELINGFRPAFIDEGILSGSQADELVAQLAKDLQEGGKWKLECPYHFVWAAKRMQAIQ
ncbi:methyltransferase domain protein [Ceratobasidium sp. AG-Ba]|nr:methyltransferase domain protein [Ceratobasidium sp. AG-Ba]